MSRRGGRWVEPHRCIVDHSIPTSAYFSSSQNILKVFTRVLYAAEMTVLLS
ncbi:Protein of unknown function [Pyronema omphalodes CBS 100304]|uniref:Uncharacterized protein n=1 Tax=Pyronema omphalodes (strain CBS 100304) TaxID=1076935 RepID=U4LA73_PYROM|nr:Protein of unknown function [Pyronema omphalodes CBS 100304]